MHKLPLRVAGAIFVLIAVAHLLRLIFKIEIIAAGSMVPLWMSLPALIFMGLLSAWMFRSAK